jgi:hypothetical protein
VRRKVTVDLNLDWQLRRELFVYLNAQNVFDRPEILERRGALTPAYARRYQEMTHGVQLTLGLKGSF